MATMMTSTVPLTAENAHELGVEAFVYFYPLVTMEITRRQMTNAPAGARPGFGPMNAFSHMRSFPDADFRAVVRPNFDTLYSSAWLDLTSEPMVLSLPASDRYYLLELLDMWTEAFAVPGTRTSGTGAGSFAVLPPGWHGELPEGVEPIPAPTSHVWAIARVQTNGPDDYPTVHRIQDGFAVTPLSRWGRERVITVPEMRVDPAVDMGTAPLEQVHALSAEDFLGLAADLLRLHPPHLADWSTMVRLQRLGIRAGQPFDPGRLNVSARAAIANAPADALDRMRWAVPRLAKRVNGWQLHAESIGVYGDCYLKRAMVTMVGLGANQPEDAIYPLAVADSDGRPIDGEHDYLLHFGADRLPPVDAFWSVTMYDDEGFQTANPINRYAIGDRDALAYNPDGSLDISIQHDSPGPERESNWLPAPRGPLGITMRLYAPRPEALDGRWDPPPLVRVR